MSASRHHSQAASRRRGGPLVLLSIASLLFILQIFAGTSAGYAALIFLFNVVSFMVVSELGGIGSLNGMLVGFAALKVVWFSQFLKVILWESADGNLLCPLETPLVMVVAMASVGFAAYVVSRLRIPRTLTSVWKVEGSWLVAGITATGISMISWLVTRATESGTILFGMATYAQSAMGLGATLITAHYIRTSGRLRSLGPWSLPALGFPFLVGIISSSKYYMFLPIFAYIATCFYFSYRMSARSVAAIGAVCVVSVMVLAPLAQVGRYAFVGMGPLQTVEGAFGLISSSFSSSEGLSSLQTMAEPSNSVNPEEIYYDADVGFANRFSLIGSADRLIDATIRNGTEGIFFALAQMPILPKSFFGEATGIAPNNYLGYKAGFISMHDTNTSIAFGIFADAFAVEGWLGAAVLPFLAFGLVFLVHRLLGERLQGNPFPIYLLLEVQHTFAEATIGYAVFYTMRLMPVYITLYMIVVAVSKHFARSPSQELGTLPSSV